MKNDARTNSLRAIAGVRKRYPVPPRRQVAGEPLADLAKRRRAAKDEPTARFQRLVGHQRSRSEAWRDRQISAWLRANPRVLGASEGLRPEDRYFTNADVEARLFALARAHPDLIHIRRFKDPSEGGRPIYTLIIGRLDRKGARHHVINAHGHSGDELLPAAAAIAHGSAAVNPQARRAIIECGEDPDADVWHYVFADPDRLAELELAETLLPDTKDEQSNVVRYSYFTKPSLQKPRNQNTRRMSSWTSKENYRRPTEDDYSGWRAMIDAAEFAAMVAIQNEGDIDLGGSGHNAYVNTGSYWLVSLSKRSTRLSTTADAKARIAQPFRLLAHLEEQPLAQLSGDASNAPLLAGFPEVRTSMSADERQRHLGGEHMVSDTAAMQEIAPNAVVMKLETAETFLKIRPETAEPNSSKRPRRNRTLLHRQREARLLATARSLNEEAQAARQLINALSDLVNDMAEEEGNTLRSLPWVDAVISMHPKRSEWGAGVEHSFVKIRRTPEDELFHQLQFVLWTLRDLKVAYVAMTLNRSTRLLRIEAEHLMTNQLEQRIKTLAHLVHQHAVHSEHNIAEHVRFQVLLWVAAAEAARQDTVLTAEAAGVDMSELPERMQDILHFEPDHEQIPQHHRAHARRIVLDLLGAATRGEQLLPITDQILKTVIDTMRVHDIIAESLLRQASLVGSYSDDSSLLVTHLWTTAEAFPMLDEGFRRILEADPTHALEMARDMFDIFRDVQAASFHERAFRHVQAQHFADISTVNLAEDLGL